MDETKIGEASSLHLSHMPISNSLEINNEDPKSSSEFTFISGHHIQIEMSDYHELFNAEIVASVGRSSSKGSFSFRDQSDDNTDQKSSEKVTSQNAYEQDSLTDSECNPEETEIVLDEKMECSKKAKQVTDTRGAYDEDGKSKSCCICLIL